MLQLWCARNFVTRPGYICHALILTYLWEWRKVNSLTPVMTVKWSSQSFLGMNGWDLRLCHYSTPEVDSELLRLILLDLVQLGLWVKRFWLRLLLSKQPPTQLFHRTNNVLGTYSWHTNFPIKVIVSLLGIALTPRAEKPLMTSLSASMKVFQQGAFHSPDTDVLSCLLDVIHISGTCTTRKTCTL